MQEQAHALARQLGAGQVLTGEVVGSPQRLAALTSTSFPALLAYLEGQRMYRNGQYEEAAAALERAVLTDTTFALAALGLRVVAAWVGGASQRRIELGSRIAWQGRDRLGPRDRAVLESYTGNAYPRPLSSAELLHFTRRAADMAPDRPETWYELGDAYYHHGPFTGLGDHIESARSAFLRALAIDSVHTAALEHLIEVEALRGDTASLRRWASIYLDARADAELVDYHRWPIARALGDSATLAELRAHFDRMTPPNLWRIMGWGTVVPGAYDDAARARTGSACAT